MYRNTLSMSLGCVEGRVWECAMRVRLCRETVVCLPELLLKKVSVTQKSNNVSFAIIRDAPY